MSDLHEALPLTQVFIDYESWFWGMYNAGSTPDLQSFIQDIKKRGRLEQIHVFGDFTRDEIKTERNKLRTITNNIIDCANYETKKDFTDFIMLDHIYRTILQRPDVHQYVLVTGDGHFHSVIAYLKTFLDKIVGVYGVKGTLSHQLRECASWSMEFEVEGSLQRYQTKILENLYWAESHSMIPSFARTVDICSKLYKLDKTQASAALSKLIADGFIKQDVIEVTNHGTPAMIKRLVPDWENIFNSGLATREAIQQQSA